ncbi:hypothetical protein O3M35_001165 [Rhynocoris fuscipes]|uniref:C2H2-type domain-containing protein n=1 Tax=Rhynocoris fuscipes TaxID=488301 RepID=A0AAW1DTX6_9HEMI
MTLPMVTCPLCCRPGFSSTESLCSALVDVTTRSLSCPICNCKVTGLDKFTIHLFSHSFSHNTNNNSNQVANSSEADSGTKCDNLTIEGEKHQYSHYNNSSFDKHESYLRNNITSKITKNIPSDQSYIFFRTDNGQIFAVSHESFSPNFKNVTINTQNYITNTNITTSTIQSNSFGNVEERKHLEVSDNDSPCSTNAMDVESNNALFTNGESLHSCPSTPSTFADVDKCRNERVYESCKELLTNGDFTTNGTDLGDLERNDSYVENKNSGENKSNNKESENKPVESYICEQCSYVFPNKTILAMHNQLIHKKGENEVENRRQSLNCNLCPRSFTLRSSLMIHRKVAHAGGFGNNDSTLSIKDSTLNNSCQVCGKIFSKAIYLSQHMKVHEEKQWLCTICDKGFTTKYFLKKHRRLHTDVSVCSVTNKHCLKSLFVI